MLGDVERALLGASSLGAEASPEKVHAYIVLLHGSPVARPEDPVSYTLCTWQVPPLEQPAHLQSVFNQCHTEQCSVDKPRLHPSTFPEGQQTLHPPVNSPTATTQ